MIMNDLVLSYIMTLINC